MHAPMAWAEAGTGAATRMRVAVALFYAGVPCGYPTSSQGEAACESAVSYQYGGAGWWRRVARGDAGGAGGGAGLHGRLVTFGCSAAGTARLSDQFLYRLPYISYPISYPVAKQLPISYPISYPWPSNYPTSSLQGGEW